jgi:hypothetical protein
LDQTGDAIIEEVASELNDLRSDRNDADYQLNKTDVQNESTATLIVERARDLITRLRDCRNDPTRYDRVKNAIRARHLILRGLARP